MTIAPAAMPAPAPAARPCPERVPPLQPAFVHVIHVTGAGVGAAAASSFARCAPPAAGRPRAAAARRRVVPSLGLPGPDEEGLGDGWAPATGARWAQAGEGEGEGEPVGNPGVAVVGGGLGLGDALEYDVGGDDEVDGDDDDEDEEKDDEEDEDLASYEIETDDEDELVAGGGRGRAGGKGRDLSAGGVDVDTEDDVDDFDDDAGDLVDVGDGARVDDEIDAVASVKDGDGDEDDEDDPADDVFDEESEAELRSAAQTLKGSGLLGLGVDGAARSDASELASFVLGGEGFDETRPAFPSKTGGGPVASPALASLPDLVKQAEVTLPIDDDDADRDEFDEPPGLEEEDPLAGPKNLDSYTDDDEHDDEVVDFGVTSAGSFGRIWELNDDAYVTISEPGDAYAYDIDEGDQDDQDSAVMRRGRAGGWGGSLASDARSELPVGSKEWIARRAYDQVFKATAAEMFKWTRARKDPPPDISALFPDAPPAAPQFARTALDTSVLGADGDEAGEWVDDEDAAGEVAPARDAHDPGLERRGSGDTDGLEAIERSVDFPCVYKFKVVGSGDNFVSSLTSDMEAVLGRRVPPSAFEFEPAGRYQRIIINVEVDSARQVTDLYEAVRTASGVKFSYG